MYAPYPVEPQLDPSVLRAQPAMSVSVPADAEHAPALQVYVVTLRVREPPLEQVEP